MPCSVPVTPASIPLIVGFINDREEMTTRRAFCLASSFALGILITIAVIGLVTASVGRLWGDTGRWSHYLVAAVFLGMGLILLDVFELPFKRPTTQPQGRGQGTAFLLGGLFGIALGPCTFAFLAPVLAVTFRQGQLRGLFGAFILLFYGLGHCAVIVAAGTCTQAVQHYMNWNQHSKGAMILKKICGMLVIVGGLYLIYTGR